jgi:hypothetical protein
MYLRMVFGLRPVRRAIEVIATPWRFGSGIIIISPSRTIAAPTWRTCALPGIATQILSALRKAAGDGNAGCHRACHSPGKWALKIP